jgi:hypothetical protein
MSPDIQQARHDIADTRARLAETAAELKDTVSDQVGRAREAVSPAHYARQFPWAALGLALGAGLAIGLTGADTKAAAAAIAGAKSAGSAIGDGAVSAKDSIAEKFSADGDATPAPEPVDASSPGIRSETASAIHEMLYQGLDEILGALGVSRKQLSS